MDTLGLQAWRANTRSLLYLVFIFPFEFSLIFQFVFIFILILFLKFFPHRAANMWWCRVWRHRAWRGHTRSSASVMSMYILRKSLTCAARYSYARICHKYAVICPHMTYYDLLICPNMSRYALICPHMTYYDLIYTLECFSDEHVHLEKIADVRRKVHIRIHWAAIRTC